MTLDTIRTADAALRFIGADLSGSTPDAKGEYHSSSVAHWSGLVVATENIDGTLTLGRIVTTPSREQTETRDTRLTCWFGGRELEDGIFLPDDEWTSHPAVNHPPDHWNFDPSITVARCILDPKMLDALDASGITPEYTRALAAIGIVDAETWLEHWSAGIPAEYAVAA